MSYRVPWQYGEEAATYMAKFLDTKHRLMPYLYQLVSAKGRKAVMKLHYLHHRLCKETARDIPCNVQCSLSSLVTERPTT